MRQNMYSIMFGVLVVGAAIWAVPLAWHYKQKQKEPQAPAQEQEPFEYQ